MKILICNAGSTSLKFKLYEMPDRTVLAQASVERVGSKNDAVFRYQNKLNGKSIHLTRACIPDYKPGIELFIQHLTQGEASVIQNVLEIERVGYKTVLSKNCFGVSELTEHVLQGMRDWFDLAPIHSKAYLDSISAMREVLPNVLMVGAFETAFHESIPLERKIYGVPYEWYEKFGIQRLGYHGASHGYIADVLNTHKSKYRAISCHLGGSGSICAIKDGKSVDTSFGMSLETGLIHANRVGDMDPTMVYYLEKAGLNREEILEGLQEKGGLAGISGVSGDLRYVVEAAQQGNERAQLAVDVFVNGIVHYIGAFYLDLGGLDDLVFTAGIGEHSAHIRTAVCNTLGPLGVVLDEQENNRNSSIVSAGDSKVKVWVIPTDEELGIATRVYEYRRH